MTTERMDIFKESKVKFPRWKEEITNFLLEQNCWSAGAGTEEPVAPTPGTADYQVYLSEYLKQRNMYNEKKSRAFGLISRHLESGVAVKIRPAAGNPRLAWQILEENYDRAAMATEDVRAMERDLRERM